LAEIANILSPAAALCVGKDLIDQLAWRHPFLNGVDAISNALAIPIDLSLKIGGCFFG
jgi:hypothetical protein